MTYPYGKLVRRTLRRLVGALLRCGIGAGIHADQRYAVVERETALDRPCHRCASHRVARRCVARLSRSRLLPMVPGRVAELLDECAGAPRGLADVRADQRRGDDCNVARWSCNV